MSVCGDGYVDAALGEQCDPPDGTTCDATCHTIRCGDGRRAGSEQCDDGNTTNLDGCDANCKFEQDHRVNWLRLPMGNAATDNFCRANALGGAIVGAIAQSTVGNSLTSGVGDGSITIAFKFFGLTDLTGTNDATVMMGLLGGRPVAGAGYMGATDLDWWYTTDAATIDATRTPKTFVNGNIVGSVLNATASNITLTVTLAGSPAVLVLNNVRVTATSGASSAPTVSTGATPGHLAAENLDPALTSFASSGAQTATGSDKLCGDVTASSLQSVLAPTALVGCGLTKCNECFTATNTLLDILVTGCGSLLGAQINPTNPDHSTVAGTTYRFTVNAAHVVNGCTDQNRNPVPLATCLANAEYSTYFRFTTDRVIMK
jgi:cysteine-rich repeat protein